MSLFNYEVLPPLLTKVDSFSFKAGSVVYGSSGALLRSLQTFKEENVIASYEYYLNFYGNARTACIELRKALVQYVQNENLQFETLGLNIIEQGTMVPTPGGFFTGTILPGSFTSWGVASTSLPIPVYFFTFLGNDNVEYQVHYEQDDLLSPPFNMPASLLVDSPDWALAYSFNLCEFVEGGACPPKSGYAVNLPTQRVVSFKIEETVDYLMPDVCGFSPGISNPLTGFALPLPEIRDPVEERATAPTLETPMTFANHTMELPPFGRGK